MSPGPNKHSGSILFAIYASIAMVALIGVIGMRIMKGPVRAMSEVTRHTVAENNMVASGRVALIAAARQVGDCDGDGVVEPVEWRVAASAPAPANGGLLPANMGATLKDPWGNDYGYCGWDHGSKRLDTACGVNPRRLTGSLTGSNLVIAVISSGPNRRFETGCQPDGGGNYIVQSPGNDDIVQSYSLAEAMAVTNGLWNLKTNDAATATIAKNISVTDSGGTEQLSFNAASRQFSLGAGGIGAVPNIKTDYIQNLTTNAPIEFLSNIKMGTGWISGDGSNKGVKIATDGSVNTSGDLAAAGAITAGTASISTATANAVAAIVTSSGSSGVGLKATGALKAIEAQGVIDMMSHKIINLTDPTLSTDAATKNYVDNKTAKVLYLKCDSFISSSCSGSGATNLTKTSLGACKAACEAAGSQCCEASFPVSTNNPNTMLSTCKGYPAPSQPGGINILIGGLFGTIAAFCYQQYQ